MGSVLKRYTREKEDEVVEKGRRGERGEGDEEDKGEVQFQLSPSHSENSLDTLEEAYAALKRHPGQRRERKERREFREGREEDEERYDSELSTRYSENSFDSLEDGPLLF